MKKHLKRLLSLMMAALLCIGVMPSSAFAASYDYDGYISMIDHTIELFSFPDGVSVRYPIETFVNFEAILRRISDKTANVASCEAFVENP